MGGGHFCFMADDSLWPPIAPLSPQTVSLTLFLPTAVLPFHLSASISHSLVSHSPPPSRVFLAFLLIMFLPSLSFYLSYFRFPLPSLPSIPSFSPPFGPSLLFMFNFLLSHTSFTPVNYLSLFFVLSSSLLPISLISYISDPCFLLTFLFLLTSCLSSTYTSYSLLFFLSTPLNFHTTYPLLPSFVHLPLTFLLLIYLSFYTSFCSSISSSIFHSPAVIQ